MNQFADSQTPAAPGSSFTLRDQDKLLVALRRQSIEADIRASVEQGFRTGAGVRVPTVFRRPWNTVPLRIHVPFAEALADALDQAYIVGLMLDALREPQMLRAQSKLAHFERAVADFLVDRDADTLALIAEAL